jgi:hypothetical protein
LVLGIRGEERGNPRGKFDSLHSLGVLFVAFVFGIRVYFMHYSWLDWYLHLHRVLHISRMRKIANSRVGTSHSGQEVHWGVLEAFHIGWGGEGGTKQRRGESGLWKMIDRQGFETKSQHNTKSPLHTSITLPKCFFSYFLSASCIKL